MSDINYSIIIPHYNTPQLLRRCLCSIPERSDVQVIVVDDNSPDNEKYYAEIPELKRNNVEFYVAKEKLGAGHARNLGLKQADGKWLIFADSDDFFVNEFSFILDEYLHSEADVIYFNIQRCNSDDTNVIFPLGKQKLFENYRKTGNIIDFKLHYGEAWGKFFKREYITEKQITFQETIANNDFLFSIKASFLTDKVKVVDRPLYWYTYREGSIANSKETFEKLKVRVAVHHDVYTFLTNNGICPNMYLPFIHFRKSFNNGIIIPVKLFIYMFKNNMYCSKLLLECFKYLINYFK